MARHYDWDLASHAGQRGYVEIVDGMTDLDGFGWLAISRFEPAVITVPDRLVGEVGSARADLFRLAGQLKLKELTKEITTAAEPSNSNLITRLAATDALVMLEPERAIAP